MAQKKQEPALQQLHSIRAAEVDEAIERLGSSDDPEASRELLRFYRECGWRSTQFKIIAALGRHPRQRHLEFLFRIARGTGDIPMAEAAIAALGRSHHALAARFLNPFYKSCPETLRPAVIAAIGELPDRTLAAEFTAELPRALNSSSFLLARNLMLTLGELKVTEAAPVIERFVQKSAFDPSPSARDPLLIGAALMALGKLGRNPGFFSGLEDAFRSDLQNQQLFSAARTQVQFRSQWRLEDYLSRFFEAPDPHPSLPFELNGFKPEDVLEGLRLCAAEPGRLERTCLALSRMDCAGIEKWYFELFDLAAIAAGPEPVRLRLLRSISSHWRPGMLEPLRALLPASGPDVAWFEAASLSLPDADEVFAEAIAGESFGTKDEAERIAILNHLVNFGLASQAVPKKLQAVSRILETLIEKDPGSRVRGRILRAAGALGLQGHRIASSIRKSMEDPALLGSCLNCLELLGTEGGRANPTLIKTALEQAASSKAPTGSLAALLRMLAQSDPLIDSPRLEKILEEALAQNDDEPLQLAALRLAALRLPATRPPSTQERPRLLPAIRACLKSKSTQVELDAVIALGACKDPAIAGDIAGELAPLLESPLKAMAGRALHALTELPGVRARRLVIDHLKSRALDPDICLKVARSLSPPETGHEYFIASINEILSLHKDHPQADELIGLRDRIAAARPSPAAGAGRTVMAADIATIDRELAARIPGYERFDAAVQSVLRSAEVPHLKPEIFDEFVDKSSSIVEYCKAVDLLLERDLGKKLLFPRLERSLHEFQNAVHAAELNSPSPQAERVMRRLGLEAHFTARSFPVHKMGLIAQSILNGRILDERFNTLDGLRAWAMVLLLFGRNAAGPEQQIRPLIPLKAHTDAAVLPVCKALISLQEARNPAAHRQTFTERGEVEEIRSAVFAVMKSLQKLL